MRFAASILAAWAASLALVSGFRVSTERKAEPLASRPLYTDYARMARWLVHKTDWGVVSTISRHLQGVPFGNVLSHSDGPWREPTGRLLFYLTTMDATAQDLELNSSASVTISEGQLSLGCLTVDPQDPTCAKLSLSGSMEPVPPQGVAEAKRLLFSRHPDMKNWPAGHDFRVYELHIQTARLLDWYGGPHDISKEEYFAVKPDPDWFAKAAGSSGLGAGAGAVA